MYIVTLTGHAFSEHIVLTLQTLQSCIVNTPDQKGKPRLKQESVLSRGSRKELAPAENSFGGLVEEAKGTLSTSCCAAPNLRSLTTVLEHTFTAASLPTLRSYAIAPALSSSFNSKEASA